MKNKCVPPELVGNYCHIAPDWERGEDQKLWFVSAPYGGTVLRFQGEPTSLLYAIAPVVDEVRKTERGEDSLLPSLRLKDIALLNPTVGCEKLYDEIEQRLQSQELRVLCISALTASSQEARRIATIAKNVSPETITIFGGPHEDDIELKTAVDTTFTGVADFSVAGDGEFMLLHLTELIFKNPAASLEEIKELVLHTSAQFRSCPGRGGIHFQHNGRRVCVPASQIMPDVSTPPLMPRELLYEGDTRTFSVFKKRGWNVKTAQIMTQRGCAWRCSFCSESSKLNSRTLESVVEEIQHVLKFNEHHPKRDAYEAIFFDDSTFTTRSKSRMSFLNELFRKLKAFGVEWGCQTRLDQIDEEILEKMKDAGCTYVFTGLESASDEMLKAMVKDQGRREISRAFDAINKVGIRAGISLVFGVAEPESDTTRESEQTIRETIAFVKQETKQGQIVLVSPNVATYYPHTRMTSAFLNINQTNLPTSAEGDSLAAPIVRPLEFQRSLVNTGYPWNRFEEGEGYHPRGMTRKLAGLIVHECIKSFGEFLVAQDIYAIEEYQEAYRNGALDDLPGGYVDFNHASITRPSVRVRVASRITAEHEEGFHRSDRTEMLHEARRRAAALAGLNAVTSRRVALARNTTEAASLVYWMAGLHLEENAKIVLTNAENLSIARAFRFIMDHGNPDGRDFWSSFQDFGVQRPKLPLERKLRDNVEIDEADVLFSRVSPEDAILSKIRTDTRLVVFSHVIRDNGYILDVGSLCSKIRRENPGVHILVDGAQALGALPQVKFDELGCDFYVGTPHKTLGSFPLGILYFNERVEEEIFNSPYCFPPAELPSLVPEGMFDPALKVKSALPIRLSLPEVKGFIEAMDELAEKEMLLREGNCWPLEQHRRGLKRLFSDALSKQFTDVQIASDLQDTCKFSNFILSFRFKGEDNRLLVEHLWKEHLIFVSYIARSDLIRASFGPDNTEEQVTRAINAIKDLRVRVLKSAVSNTVQSFDQAAV
jgi:selenocysteine lyase/cysteine desulfurase/radical SAM superfamily enzyme YgiQ (UPF0313 family)